MSIAFLTGPARTQAIRACLTLLHDPQALGFVSHAAPSTVYIRACPRPVKAACMHALDCPADVIEIAWHFLTQAQRNVYLAQEECS